MDEAQRRADNAVSGLNFKDAGTRTQAVQNIAQILRWTMRGGKSVTQKGA